MTKGSLIIIEGIDGSGKTTQIDLLKKYLDGKNIAYEAISFPRYGENLYGKLVRRYLSGEFGSIDKVNPYLVSLAYAGDRLLAKPLIEAWLNEGKIVIANRYVSSSIAHLGANLPEGTREGFMRWVDELEYKTNKLPKENLTILLNVDPHIGQKNVQGGEADIHEDNLPHLEEAAKIYLELSKSEQNWKVINCMEDGRMRSQEEIHKDLAVILTNLYVY